MIDWELDEEEEKRLQGCAENELLLNRLPRALHLKVLGATKHLHSTIGEGILRLTPEYKIWSRDGKGNAKVRRRGFQVVPDFGGTAHAYCGDSLDTAIGDLLEWDCKPTLDAMQRAYIIKSRVRDASGLAIVQPYSPALFRQGVLPGPALLLQRQKGEISKAELKAAWKKSEKPEEDASSRKDCSIPTHASLNSVEFPGFPCVFWIHF